MQLRHITRQLDQRNPDILTIGFARRFATYKRASLIMRDRARLRASSRIRSVRCCSCSPARRIPADHPGQQVLREIKQLMLQPEFAGRVVFLEDYDIQLARWLVTGVDVWLNNPIAPLEASGTSGIKAAINGRLNLSILDGWWAEAFDGENGWGIPGADVQDERRRDELDSDTILDAIEEEVAPLYYARNARGTVDRMGAPLQARDAHRGAALQHAAHRARLRGGHVPARGAAGRAAVAGERRRAPSGSRRGSGACTRRGRRCSCCRCRTCRATPRWPRRSSSTVAVELGGLEPADVRVEFKAKRQLPEAVFEHAPLCSFGHGLPIGQWREELAFTGQRTETGAAVFEMSAVAPGAGQYLPELRVYPFHELLTHPLEMGLMKRI